jgi:ribosomal protein L20A (L18A)
MKFVVAGSIRKGTERSFEIGVEAKNEKHASALAMVKIGGAQGIAKSMITISSVKKGEKK